MKPGCTLLFLLCSALTVTTAVYTQTLDTVTTTSYLLAGAPTPDLSIGQSREDFDNQNLSLPLNESRATDSDPDKTNLARVANKTNENLYASTTLERSTLKIKSIQVTWLPIQGPKQKAMKVKAQAYMAAVVHILTPLMTKTQSQKELQSLLTARKDKRYRTETEGALCYVVVGSGEKGPTFAVRPIKLALSGSFEGSNERQKAKPLCQ